MRTREELTPIGCQHRDKRPCYECLFSDYLDVAEEAQEAEHELSEAAAVLRIAVREVDEFGSHMGFDFVDLAKDFLARSKSEETS